jgi:DNA-directed RNA polymerase subunit M/transcription elongation factor TFIIS
MRGRSIMVAKQHSKVQTFPRGKLVCNGCGSSDTVEFKQDSSYKDAFMCRKCGLLMQKEGAKYESGKTYRKQKPKVSEAPTGSGSWEPTDRPG